MPFGRNAVIRLEHGGTDESTEHYETVTYWYGLPSASLVQTDMFQIGDIASEKKHGYSSLQASAPYTITSRYEWGIDTLDGKEIYPAQTDRGRTIKATSEFRLGSVRTIWEFCSAVNSITRSRIKEPKFMSPINPNPLGKLAGIWYLAGSNTCVYSNPKEELGATQHIVETSNRRFRDDEFLISRELTRGRKAIWVLVKFTPVDRPLYPGYPLGEQAWSEIKYTAYCFVLPGKR